MPLPEITVALESAIPKQLIRPAWLQSIASDAIAIIRRRVQGQGKGLDDTMMPAYEDSTVESRGRRGRGTNIRDLTDSGRMMRAIHVEGVSTNATGIVATIGFSTGRARFLAGIHQARHSWFGFSRIDRTKIIAIMQASLAAEAQSHMDAPNK